MNGGTIIQAEKHSSSAALLNFAYIFFHLYLPHILTGYTMERLSIVELCKKFIQK
jgi:hypothetical protein